jgi:hypothetical protein
MDQPAESRAPGIRAATSATPSAISPAVPSAGGGVAKGPGLLDLADGCLALVLQNLHTIVNWRAFGLTCKRFARIAAETPITRLTVLSDHEGVIATTYCRTLEEVWIGAKCATVAWFVFCPRLRTITIAPGEAIMLPYLHLLPAGCSLKFSRTINEGWCRKSLFAMTKIAELELGESALLAPESFMWFAPTYFCHHGTTVPQLAAMCAAWSQTLTRLALINPVVAGQELEPLADLRKLYAFALNGATAACLAPITGISNLRQLSLASCTGLQRPNALRVLAICHGLRWLAVENSDLGGVAGIEALPLERLVLSRTRVADLRPLGAMPLRTLKVDGCPVADWAPLAGLRELRWLTVGGADLGAARSANTAATIWTVG